MLSYAVVGASRGIGVSGPMLQSLRFAEAGPDFFDLQLGFVKKLSADPQNIVFALVRNPDASPDLQEFLSAGYNAHNNVHVLKLDLVDLNSIEVCN